MTVQLLAILALGVASAIALVFTVFVAYPRYELSIFRYSLWEIRDELWDRIYLGELSEDPRAASLLEHVERSIRIASVFTIARAFLAYRAVKRLPESRLKESERRVAEHMAPSSPEVEAIREALRAALFRYITRGSVLGWSLVPARRVWLRILPAPARGGVDENAEADDRVFALVSSLGPLGRNNDQAPLSSYV